MFDITAGDAHVCGRDRIHADHRAHALEGREEVPVRGHVRPEAGERVDALPTLIEMKTAAGRAQDMIDIEHLKIRVEDHGGK